VALDPGGGHPHSHPHLDRHSHDSEASHTFGSPLNTLENAHQQALHFTGPEQSLTRRVLPAALHTVYPALAVLVCAIAANTISRENFISMMSSYCMIATLASAAVPLYLFHAVRVYSRRAGDGSAGAAGGAGAAGPGAWAGPGRGEEMWAGAQAEHAVFSHKCGMCIGPLLAAVVIVMHFKQLNVSFFGKANFLAGPAGWMPVNSIIEVTKCVA